MTPLLWNILIVACIIAIVAGIAGPTSARHSTTDDGVASGCANIIVGVIVLIVVWSLI